MTDTTAEAPEKPRSRRRKKSEALVPTNAPAAAQLALKLGAEMGATSLELTDPNITYMDWENIGRSLGLLGTAYQWWVGDWLIYGETLFGEESAQAVSDPAGRVDLAAHVINRDPATLANWRRICEKVAKSRRRPEIPFSTHAAVAELDPDEQVEWLEKVVGNGWTRQQLVQALNEAKAPPQLTAADANGDGGGDRESNSERLERIARLVFHQAQRSTNGDAVVPAELWAQFAVALGEGE